MGAGRVIVIKKDPDMPQTCPDGNPTKEAAQIIPHKKGTATMKRNYKPTEEQKAKAEARRAHLRELADRIAAMTEEQKAAFLDKVGTVLTCEGHPLSLHNTLMLAYQRDGVTMVGGYNQWKNAGRQVRKGESSLGIWIPRMPKENETDAAAGIDPETQRPFFVFGNVFDISQTEPIEAEEKPYRNQAGAVVTPALREEWNKMQEYVNA